MKVLLVSDNELKELWDHWDTAGKKRTEGVGLILSAGDLRPEYLEFLVTMLNVPCLYVRGNHDRWYDENPPCGCVDIDGRIIELTVSEKVPGKAENSPKTIRVAGLGGSMRYHEGPDMYSEREMAKRVRRLARHARIGLVAGPDGKPAFSREAGRPGAIDILLTHAPAFGHGDMEDLPHRGFKCFNSFLEEFRPSYHCYGHVHMEYNGRMKRESEHTSGTHLINVCGMYVLDI